MHSPTKGIVEMSSDFQEVKTLGGLDSRLGNFVEMSSDFQEVKTMDNELHDAVLLCGNELRFSGG